MKNNFYVTTPIYYPNGKPHIGHAYTTVLADYISRYKKMCGYQVYFLTGTDEHGEKIENSAKANNLETQEYVDKMVFHFKDLWNKLGVEYTNFIRTTNTEHIKNVQNIFSNLRKNNYISKGEYEGYYCSHDESFFTPKQLIDNKKCPDCKRAVSLIKTPSYFLEVSKFEKWIKEILNEKNILIPDKRRKELEKNFLNVGLRDLSISRENLSWGIPVLEDKKHKIYVWFDALLNYLSTFEETKEVYKNWTTENVWEQDSNVEVLQIIGKEITRFHVIYWPIILKMLDYRMPKILAHGWLLSNEGEKISKSKKDTLKLASSPLELIKVFGKDTLRFYLISEVSTGEDGSISLELIKKSYNSILVNKYSNLISRTSAMVNNFYSGVVPNYIESSNTLHKKLNTNFEIKFKIFIKQMEAYNFSNSIKTVIEYIDELNKYIDLTKPWAKTKEDNELKVILNNLITGIFNASLMLVPVLLDSTRKVFDWLSYKDSPNFTNINKNFSGIKLKEIKHLFTRI